jgi:alpha-galactosidase
MSSYGKGDIREPFIEITYADGSTTCDFLFKDSRILDSKKALLTLPSAYFDEHELFEGEKLGREAQETDEALSTSGNNGSLEIELYDKNHGITLFLVYSVFYESNVITRSARVINNSDKTISLDRILSSQLDLEPGDYVISTFHGAWAREMNRYDTPAQPGILINDTKAGTSSNRSNPFFMVSTRETTEDHGDCYGFNLIYSGSHYAACEVSSMEKLRVVQGIQPSGFGFLLQPGDAFEAPEAVLTYSHKGFTGMSHNMHRFIRNHIVRGEWKLKDRPVLINSWEANYFKFNEGKLIRLAKAAKEAGVELFVLDDGWFGRREDDSSSLGDWKENRQKLGGGLKGLSNKMKSIGLDFGIWVEPEMVNEDSDLYRLHPDWAVRIPGMEHSTGRNQMFLDLTREEVRSYIIEEMSRVFTEAAAL